MELGLTVFGVIMGFVWYLNNRNNNRVIKEIQSETCKLIQGTQEMIKEESKLTRETTRELIEKISLLIVSDGEKTREILRSLKPITG